MAATRMVGRVVSVNAGQVAVRVWLDGLETVVRLAAALVPLALPGDFMAFALVVDEGGVSTLVMLRRPRFRAVRPATSADA